MFQPSHHLKDLVSKSDLKFIELELGPQNLVEFNGQSQDSPTPFALKLMRLIEEDETNRDLYIVTLSCYIRRHQGVDGVDRVVDEMGLIASCVFRVIPPHVDDVLKKYLPLDLATRVINCGRPNDNLKLLCRGGPRVGDGVIAECDYGMLARYSFDIKGLDIPVKTLLSKPPNLVALSDQGRLNALQLIQRIPKTTMNEEMHSMVVDFILAEDRDLLAALLSRITDFSMMDREMLTDMRNAIQLLRSEAALDLMEAIMRSNYVNNKTDANFVREAINNEAFYLNRARHVTLLKCIELIVRKNELHLLGDDVIKGAMMTDGFLIFD